MNVRKEKEKDFFVQHMDTFRAMGHADPFFIIKTAFFSKKVSLVDKFSSLNLRLVKVRMSILSSMTMSQMIKELL